ncbi:MAG: competence/damage-inducible protein A [Flavobacteriales bacterium]|nr:competence/damage-inducible protein A [Flavobacteriales bacterium]
MTAEIITIGDEILIGQVVDTNSAWMGSLLEKNGLKVIQITSISDEKDAIINALLNAKKKADVILITGGLGPTNDDITKKSLADYFGVGMVFNKEVYLDVENVFTGFNSTVSEINRHQAEVPSNCIALRNAYGTAPGMWFDESNTIYISLPGVPYEMKGLMLNEVLPRLKERFALPTIIHKTILTYGIGESKLAEMLVYSEKRLNSKGIKLAYLPAPGLVRLRLTGSKEVEINSVLEEILEVIGYYVFGYNDETLEEVVVNLLLENNRTLSAAESCTGGYLSHLVTSVSGCSKVYQGSIIAYKNEIKYSELDVDLRIIEEYGAVSKEVVEKMALGAIKKMNSDYSIATTGIAGPSGGTDDKPVGTVWIAVACGERVESKKLKFGDNRERNIRRTALASLDMLRREIIKYK